MVQYKRIGEILLEKGLITTRQLESALKMQLKTGLRFGEILTSTGKVTEEQIVQCLAEQYDYAVADPESVNPSEKALGLIDRGFALSRLVLPVAIEDGVLGCLISDPVDIGVTDTLAQSLHLRLSFALAPPTRLLAAIEKAYGIERPAVAVAEVEPPRAQAVAPRVKRMLRVQTQKDREALLSDLMTLEVPPNRRKLWSKLSSAA